MSPVSSIITNEIELFIPFDDVEKPTVTVLVPAMNEEVTIAKFCQ